uniref:C-type lectin domain-containing protein n=1 Tax=Monodelphis domestica TaxID=13616 RepID=A0A5F8GDD7_MONDO
MLSPMMAPTFSGLIFTSPLLPLSGQQDAADAPSARSSCPQGFALHGSYCYGLLGIIINETWNSAELQCQAYPSGHLLSLLNEAEAKFVASMIKEYPDVKCPIWIGLHDPNKVGPKWLSLFPLGLLARKPIIRLREFPSKPESLMKLGYFFAEFHSWRDKPCNEKYPYICKFKA